MSPAWEAGVLLLDDDREDVPAENRTPLPRLKAWDPDHWTTGTLQRRVVRRRLRALSRLSYRRTNGGLDSNQRPRAFKACSLHGIRCMESGRVELHTPRGAHPLATGLDPGSNHSPESWSGRKRSRSPRLFGAHRFRDGLGPRPIFLPWIRRPGVAPGPHRGCDREVARARSARFGEGARAGFAGRAGGGLQAPSEVQPARLSSPRREGSDEICEDSSCCPTARRPPRRVGVEPTSAG